MNVLDTFSLKDKVVLITGASSGIGRAVAIACAEAGATIGAIGRNQERLDNLLTELRQINANPHCIKSVDITDFDRIPNSVEEIVTQCGKISGFVHCAGIAQTCPLRTMNAEIYQNLYAVNVIAGFEFARAICAKRHLETPASFLFVASISALKGEPGLLAYSSSKGAILAGVRSMAAELSRKGVRVNALVPGHMIDTKMGAETVADLPEDALAHLKAKHLLGWGNVNAVTGSVIYFLSSASWWTTGSVLNIDGGYSL